MLNFVLTGYACTAGGVLFDPSVPLENAKINIDGGEILERLKNP
jgi:hypothetical protein